MSVAISVPEPYAELVTLRAQTLVEHARLNGRFLEVAIALALRDASDGQVVVMFVSKRTQRAKHVLLRMLADADFKTTKYSDHGSDSSMAAYRLNNGAEVWMCSGKTFNADELPFTHVGAVYALDCQDITTDLRRIVSADRRTLFGEIADRGHWFYEACREAGDELLKYDMAAITKLFPDTKPRVLPQTDPLYKRVMELQDVAPTFSAQSFITFARRRLKVRTDKPLEFLTERQQAEGRAQFGTPVVTFDVSQLQKRYLAAKRLAVMQGKKPWYLLLKYRRGGFTTLEQGLSYQVCQELPRSDAMTLAHTTKSTKRIVRITKVFHEKDPEAVPRLNDKSKETFEFENNSYFFIGTAGGTGEGRGDTLQRVHGSEVAKWCLGPHRMEDVDDLIAGLLGAAAHGEVVLETTPNGMEWFANEYKSARQGKSEFTPIFIRWFDDPLNRCRPGEFDPEELLATLSDEEKNLMAKHKLDLGQVAFRRQQKRVYKRLFPQEMPEDDISCFIQSGTCYFDTDELLEMLEKMPDPDPCKWGIPGGYEAEWEKPVKNEEYVLGCDTSEGLPGCDPNGVGVIRKSTGAQVAAVHGLFNPRVLAEHAVRLGQKYNNGLLAVERENHGHAVIQKVLEIGGNQYRKPHFRGGSMYFFDVREDIKKARAGWSTNGNTRDVLLDGLSEAIMDGLMGVKDREFVDEALSFKLQSNGKFEADPGAHDDQVIKWGIAWQMKKYARSKPKITFLGGSK